MFKSNEINIEEAIVIAEKTIKQFSYLKIEIKIVLENIKHARLANFCEKNNVISIYLVDVLKEVNYTFSINKQLLKNMLVLYIKFLILHEYKHYLQFLNGMSLQDYIQDKQNYENQANRYAYDKLKGYHPVQDFLLELISFDGNFKSFVFSKKLKLDHDYKALQNKYK